MAGSIITPTDKDLIIHPALQRLVKRNGWAHKFLLNLSKSVEARLQLKVMIDSSLSYGGNDGYIVAFGAHVVG